MAYSISLFASLVETRVTSAARPNVAKGMEKAYNGRIETMTVKEKKTRRSPPLGAMDYDGVTGALGRRPNVYRKCACGLP